MLSGFGKLYKASDYIIIKKTLIWESDIEIGFNKIVSQRGRR